MDHFFNCAVAKTSYIALLYLIRMDLLNIRTAIDSYLLENMY